MRIAFLTLTTRCNRRCPYCFYETGYQSRGDTDHILSVDRRLLSALGEAGVDKLILTGGEPLLAPRLDETVRRAAEMGFYTLLLTNGDLLDPRRLNGLVDAGLRALSISLDALGEGPLYKAPWDLLERLAAHEHLNQAVITPVTRQNLDEMAEVVRRLVGLGLFVLLQPVFVPEESDLYEKASLSASTRQEMDKFVELIRYWESLYGLSRYAELIKDYYTRKGTRPPYCSMGTETVVVDSNGDVMPCFHRRDLTTGNIEESDPGSVLARSFKAGDPLRSAPCFGEHCISLFSHL